MPASGSQCGTLEQFDTVVASGNPEILRWREGGAIDAKPEVRRGVVGGDRSKCACAGGDGGDFEIAVAAGEEVTADDIEHGGDLGGGPAIDLGEAARRVVITDANDTDGAGLAT